MSVREPSRLCEASSTADDLRKMIACAREDGPDESHMASLLARLPEIEAAADPPASPAPVGPAPAMSAFRILPLVTVTILVGGGLWFYQGRDDAQTTSANQPVPASLHSVVAHTEKPETPAPLAHVEAVPTKTAAALHTAPPTRPGAEVTADVKTRGPRESASAVSASERAKPTELALLADAREALQAKRWSRAIRSARLHERHYPDGMLGEEREAIAIEALWKEGMRAQATLRLKQMTEAYPQSSYRKQLEILVSEP